MLSPPPEPGPPPPVRGGPGRPIRSIDYGLAEAAIEAVKAALPYVYVGPPLIRVGPAGGVHVDVPLMYHDYALDHVHYDPYARAPSPKGRPVRVWGVEVREEEVRKVMEEVLREARVVDAVEYREPEDAWAVPLAWRHIIIAHVKVTYDASQLVPDYGLTGEVRRNVL